MNAKLAILCDAANGSPDGKLNILGEFTQFGSSSFPHQQSSISLVMRLEPSPLEKNTTKTIKVVVVDQDGKPLAPPAQIAVVVPDQQGDIELLSIIAMNGLIFPRPGQYRVDITVDDYSVREVRFGVLAIPSPTTHTQIEGQHE